MLDDLLYTLTPFAPLMIVIASFLDTFIGTGYLLYGFTMLATVSMLYLEGTVSLPEIIIAAFLGTTLASVTNYSIGRWWSQTQFVQARMNSAPVLKLTQLLDQYGSWWFILIGRFTTFLRPSYAFVLGTFKRPLQRFLLFEGIIALIWVSFWIVLITLGIESII